MVASGNVGLAFGLVAAAAAATSIGACVVFCASLAKPRFLAASLGFAAGVMLCKNCLYEQKGCCTFTSNLLRIHFIHSLRSACSDVSFAEIFLRKSVDSFVEADYSPEEAYRYSTLAFFGGFLIVFLLDRVVHLVMHFIEKRKKFSRSQATLLTAEDSAVVQSGRHSPTSIAIDGHDDDVDVEPGSDISNATSIEAVAVTTSSKCTSRCPPIPIIATRHQCSNEEDGPASKLHESDTQDKPTGAAGGGMTAGITSTREQIDIMHVLEEDPHNFALHKMGILTATAIFLHNLPEGLATFVAALSDTSVGIGICIAIAMHNVPEGICVALPIYYATGSKIRAFSWAMLSGLSEPLGALVGWLALYGDNSLSFAIVFALVSGMMVYISIKELFPMALRYDPKDTVATTAVVVGMIVMAGSLLLFTI